ncbi:hypothetical protein [Domibacillus robiginosus]|uniref:hypothetical protein n=1 Tax=Domibacillus robiginosus TaxID=1071054 RepID=UPI00067AEFEA|nr:hypothetical protein [Domibacillus robiginosus]
MDEPDWTRRDGEVLIWQMPGEETALPKPKKKPALKAGAGIVIVLAALVTGSVFGLLMMSAVPEQQPAKEAQAASAVPEKTAAPMEETDQKETAPAQKTVSFFVLQGGLFSTKTAADEAASASKEQAAVLSSDDQYSMIYGIYFTKSEADEAERQLEAGGTAAYVKETETTVSDEEEAALRKAAQDQQLEEAVSIISP